MGLILELKNVSKSFGKLQAVSDLSLQVAGGDIHGLIGPNGAGKTTAFNLITGFYRPASGSVWFDGEDITGLPSHIVAAKGLTRSFQQTLVFGRQTVLTNVLTGCHMSSQAGPVREFFHSRRAREADRTATAEAERILELMGLCDLRDEMAGNLSHGDQKALGVSVALACKPKVLLLDEPVTGMNHTETAEMAERIKRIRDSGITLLLVEHEMQLVMSICDRVTVLDYGRKIAEGLPEEIRMHREVIEAYLGQGEDDVARS